MSMTQRRPPALQTIVAGGRTIRLQHMAPEQAPALLAFARKVPAHDLLFLPIDITEVAGINEWVDGVVHGHTGVILALDEEEVVGFAAVVRHPTRWMRHIAEISIVVGESVRRQGIGRQLTNKAFRIAADLGVTRMLAQMTLDQRAAIRSFRRLGFVPLAILHDHVIDEDRQTYDLMMMHQDVASFQETLRQLDEGS